MRFSLLSQPLWLLEIIYSETYTDRTHKRQREVLNNDKVEKNENSVLPILDDSCAGSVYVHAAHSNIKLTV